MTLKVPQQIWYGNTEMELDVPFLVDSLLLSDAREERGRN